MPDVLTVNRLGYKFKGQTYPRVTTIKGILGAGEALIDWAAGEVAGEVSRLIASYQDGKLNLPNLLTCLQAEDLKKAHIKTRDAKADYGTLFHDLAESCAKGIPYDIPPHLLAASEGFLTWMESVKPQYLYAETVMVSRTHGYAGKCDAILRINDQIILVDYKTSKNVYIEFALQMAAYRYADFIAWPDGNETPIPAIDHCAVLHVLPSGECKLLHIEAGPDQYRQFLNCLDLYNWKKTQPKPTPFVAQRVMELADVFA